MWSAYAPLLLDQVFSLTEYQPIMITISVGYAQSVTSTNVIAAVKTFMMMKIALLMTFTYDHEPADFSDGAYRVHYECLTEEEKQLMEENNA